MAPLIMIERHLRLTGIPPTRFGRDAVGDPRLVHDLAAGRLPGARTLARIEDYIARTAHVRPFMLPSLRRSRRGWGR